MRKLNLMFGRRDRWQAAGVLVLMGIGAAFESLGVALIFPLLAVLADPAAAAEIPFGRWITPTTVLGIYLLKVLYLAGLYAFQYRFIFSRQVSLSRRLFSAYLHAPYAIHLRRNSADLLRNLNQEIHWIFSGVLVPGASVIIETLVVAMILIVLLWADPLSAFAVVLVLGAAGAIFYRAIRARTGTLGAEQQRYSGEMIRRVQEGIGGIKEIQLMGRQRWFLDAYTGSTVGYTRALRYLRTMAEMPRLAIEALMVIGIVAVIVTLDWRGQDPASALPLLGLIGMAAIRLMPSLNRIGVGITSMRYYAPAMDAVARDLASLERSGSGDESAPRGRLPFRNRIEVAGVTFTYPGADRPALKDVSLAIEKGQRVAFVGPSGAGKTTIVDVILGLLRPEQGQIRVDGVDIQTDLRAWQNVIGYIPQHVFLADDTIRRNVAFGVPDEEISDDRVREALEMAQLAEVVDALPEKEETRVGERGVRLSGGQRQRIGIARALYHDPEVLVLDEATSALDNETEEAIAGAVAELGGSKTILIIAHRLSTVERCDSLFFLRDGRITASERSYRDLLESSAEFRAMAAAGSGGAAFE